MKILVFQYFQKTTEVLTFQMFECGSSCGTLFLHTKRSVSLIFIWTGPARGGISVPVGGGGGQAGPHATSQQAETVLQRLP